MPEVNVRQTYYIYHTVPFVLFVTFVRDYVNLKKVNRITISN